MEGRCALLKFDDEPPRAQSRVRDSKRVAHRRTAAPHHCIDSLLPFVPPVNAALQSASAERRAVAGISVEAHT